MCFVDDEISIFVAHLKLEFALELSFIGFILFCSSIFLFQTSIRVEEVGCLEIGALDNEDLLIGRDLEDDEDVGG